MKKINSIPAISSVVCYS